MDEIEAIFEATKETPGTITEARLKIFFWAPIMHKLFFAGNIFFDPEYPMSALGARSRRAVDYAVVQKMHGKQYPLLFVEIGRSPLRSSLVCHKDEQRMAQMLRLSLRLRLKHFRATPITELAKLRAYGLLVGGFDVELCVMLPQLDLLPDGRTCIVKFIFCTSRDSWRFSIRELPAVIASTSTDEETDSVIVVEEEESVTINDEVENAAENLPQQLLHPFVAASVEEKIFFFNPSQDREQSLLDSFSSSTTADISRSIDEDDAFIKHLNQNGLINRTAISSVVMLKGRILKQTELSLIAVSSDGSGGSTSDSSSHSVDEGRSDHTSSTPSTRDRSTSNGSSSQQPPRKAPRFEGETLLDSFPHPSINVTKPQGSGDEVDVYTHPSIVASDCFPKLISFAILDEGATIQLNLEQILTLKPFFKAEKENWLLPRLIIKFVKEIGEALDVLHCAGFVHGDVSPNNIGYNERLGRFQLFDFNHSRTVEEAGRYKRRGGTRGFRSRYYERTWLFTPQDDFVSLYLSAVIAFNLDFAVGIENKAETHSAFHKVFTEAAYSMKTFSQVLEEIERILNNSCK